MFTLIVRTLKRVGIKLILKEYSVDSYLNYYSIDFLDKYGNWCRLRIFYNDTHFFVKNVKLIGEGRRLILTDSIINSIELKGTYEDFLKCKDTNPSKEELDEFLKEGIQSLADDLNGIRVGDFLVKEVRVYCFPTLMVFVYFTFKKARVEPLRIFIGEKISYRGNLYNPDCGNDQDYLGDADGEDNEYSEGLDLFLKKVGEVLGYE